jgi:hypothetical protein
MPNARIAELVVGGTTEPWQRLGLEFVDNATVIGAVRLRVVTFLNPGLQSVGIAGLDEDDHEHHEGTCDHDHGPAPAMIHGAPIHRCTPSDLQVSNPLDARVIDHVVLMTPDLERTCGAVTAVTGAPLKRVREAPPVVQGFFRLGEVILEVVQSPQVTHQFAKWWGLVINVGDLHAVCERLGPDVISAPKAAVQPGRFIATVRSELGLGVPLALMSV